MKEYEIIFYVCVILAGGFFTIAKLTAPLVVGMMMRIGGVYLIVISMLKFLKVL